MEKGTIMKLGFAIFAVIAIVIIVFSGNSEDGVFDIAKVFSQDSIDLENNYVKRVNSSITKNEEGTELTNAERSDFISDVEATQSATDTGLTDSEGVELDWVAEGLYSKCLGITLDNKIKKKTNISVIISETDFEASDIQNISIFEQSTTKEKVDEIGYVCSGGKSVGNGSTTGETCTWESTGKKVYEYSTVWVPLTEEKEVKNKYATSKDVNIDSDGYYKVCFDTPLVTDRNIGYFGNKGTVYLEIDGTAYVDKQESSWWNTTYQFRRNIYANASQARDGAFNIPFYINGSDNSQLFTDKTCWVNATLDKDDGGINYTVYYNDLFDFTIVNEKTDPGVQTNFLCEEKGATQFNLTHTFNYPLVFADSFITFLFEEGAVNPLRDIGRTFNFTRTGNPDIIDGIFGNALNFTGLQSYHNDTITCPSASTNFTVTSWVKFNDVGTSAYVWSCEKNDGTDEALSLFYTGTQNILCAYRDSGGTQKAVSQQFTDYSEWQHITCAYDGILHMYWNGTEIGNSSAFTGASLNPGMTIGAAEPSQAANSRFLGGMEMISFYNSFKGSEWIKRDYNFSLSWLDSEEQDQSINQIPTHTTPLINSSSGFNVTIDNITLYNQSTNDANDNDFVRNIINWHISGVPFFVANLAFEGGSNDSFTRDYSGYENNGTVFGARWDNNSGFDGRGAYTFLTESENINLGADNEITTELNNSFTVGAWIKPNISSAGQTSIFGYDGTINRHNFRFTYNSINNRILLRLSNGGTNLLIGNNSATIVPEEWSHVVVTYNHTEIEFYINGERQFLVTSNPGDLSMAVLQAQLGNSAPSLGFNGTIDEFFLTNESLSAEQVELIYLNSTNLIHSTMTERGDNWTGSITVNDGSVDGDILNATLHVNRLSNFNIFDLNSSSVHNYTNGTLYLDANSFDIDTDNTVASYVWFVNNVYNNTFDNLTVIGSGNTTKGDNWTVIGTVHDEREAGTNSTSTIIILNSPPIITSVNITSDSGHNWTDGNLTVVYGFNDIDSDAESNKSIRWSRNETVINSLANVTTVYSGNTTKYQDWIAAVQVNDGSSWSNWINSTAFVINNANATIPNRNPNVTFQTYEYETLTCNDSSDVDNDIMFYEFWFYKDQQSEISQNSTNDTLFYNFGFGNGTYIFNCRAHDGVSGVGAFVSNNISIEYNNTIIVSNETNFDATPQSGSNTTYIINISYNGIRVVNQSAKFVINNNISLSVNQFNFTGLNKTHFNTTYSLPLNSSDYSLNFYWNITSFDHNGSNSTTKYSYSQDPQGISLFFSNDLCNSTFVSNNTVWKVLNLTLRHESNLTMMSGVGTDLEINFQTWVQGQNPLNNISYSFTANETNQTFICIDSPGGSSTFLSNAHIRYSSPGVDPRDFFLVNYSLDSVTDNLDLFTLPDSLAHGINHFVYDTVDDPLKGYYILVQKYYTGEDLYRTVAMGRTGDLGSDNIYLRGGTANTGDVWYRHIIKNYTKTVLTTLPQDIIHTELFFTVNENSLGAQIESIDNLEFTLSFDNTTDTFTSTFVTKDNTITDVCLTVNKLGVSGDTELCNTCDSSSSGTILCDIGTNTTGQFVATMYVKTKGYWEQVKSIEYRRGIVSSFTTTLGSDGLILTMIFAGTIIFAGLFSPFVVIILAILAFIIATILGLLNLSFFGIMGIAIAGGIIASKLKS